MAATVNTAAKFFFQIQNLYAFILLWCLFLSAIQVWLQALFALGHEVVKIRVVGIEL